MTGDLLIRNARLWPSARREVIEGGSILIKEGRIVRAGVFTGRARTVVDADGCLVMPGFVQAHVHLGQAIMRGVAEDLPLLPWLRRYIWPLEAAHTEESMRASARLACAEMIRGGTTMFLSMETTRHTHEAFVAADETGLSGFVGHCLMDETAGYPPLAADLDDALAYCDVLLDRWGEHERLGLAVAPRFALACRPENMRKASDYARDRGLMLHTHCAEQREEVVLIKERTGKTSVEYLHQAGLTGPDVGLAHCVHVNQAEMNLLLETGTHLLHCPSANFKLGSGIAPVPEYLREGGNVAIGADGAPCNNRMDAFLEMRLAGLMQKMRLGPDALPARDIVAMATEGGARALGLEEEVGSLDPGKRANLILVDSSGLHAIPSADPATSIVYSLTAADVVMTIVDGQILYEDRHLTTIDEQALREDVRREHKKLMARAGLA